MSTWTDLGTEIEGVKKAAKSHPDNLAHYIYDRASAYVGPDHQGVTTALFQAAFDQRTTPPREDERKKVEGIIFELIHHGIQCYGSADRAWMEARKETDAIFAIVQAEEQPKGVAFLLFQDGCVLMERCPKKARKFGLAEWFIPGGKINKGESVSAALVREVQEELGCAPGHPDDVTRLRMVDATAPGNRTFLMQPFVLEKWSGDVPEKTVDHGYDLRWVPLTEARRSPLEAIRAMLAMAATDDGPGEECDHEWEYVGGPVNTEGLGGVCKNCGKRSNHFADGPGEVVAEKCVGTGCTLKVIPSPAQMIHGPDCPLYLHPQSDGERIEGKLVASEAHALMRRLTIEVPDRSYGPMPADIALIIHAGTEDGDDD